jgi:hypothetical protein
MESRYFRQSQDWDDCPSANAFLICGPLTRPEFIEIQTEHTFAVVGQQINIHVRPISRRQDQIGTKANNVLHEVHASGARALRHNNVWGGE